MEAVRSLAFRESGISSNLLSRKTRAVGVPSFWWSASRIRWNFLQQFSASADGSSFNSLSHFHEAVILCLAGVTAERFRFIHPVFALIDAVQGGNSGYSRLVVCWKDSGPDSPSTGREKPLAAVHSSKIPINIGDLCADSPAIIICRRT
jgi:hypothetical protein